MRYEVSEAGDLSLRDKVETGVVTPRTHAALATFLERSGNLQDATRHAEYAVLCDKTSKLSDIG